MTSAVAGVKVTQPPESASGVGEQHYAGAERTALSQRQSLHRQPVEDQVTASAGQNRVDEQLVLVDEFGVQSARGRPDAAGDTDITDRRANARTFGPRWATVSQ